MPCTEGGTPVTIERLLGLVKDGTTQSASISAPAGNARDSQGIAPAFIASFM